jgi:hypothetical protein
MADRLAHIDADDDDATCTAHYQEDDYEDEARCQQYEFNKSVVERVTGFRDTYTKEKKKDK